ncbi:hypothetical protein ANANG_G00041950 [Anguilla anguilla]|uniref:Uncharacterized protein n=1 Tax=Anguilla anguilla TaxID=7936 RepID=A0A9D3MW26_ANGAN|nr:hypothetical protein ANANG_G00041950 [Anguilla anguilla]
MVCDAARRGTGAVPGARGAEAGRAAVGAHRAPGLPERPGREAAAAAAATAAAAAAAGLPASLAGRVPRGRGLSRQDTFDSETQGSRDSAYTEAGDSCMDIETDPYEEPEPYRGGGSRLHLSHAHGRQASWEDEGAEPDQENLNRPPVQEQHARTRQRERYCPDPGDTSSALGRNKNQEDWGNVYIR